MIRATIERTNDGLIAGFAVQGHANFAASGQDIVCAGVSAVTVGIVNAAEAVLGVVLPSEVADGWLRVEVPPHVRRDEKVQLLLESMLVMLESIQESYGSYVQVKEKIRKKEAD